jgi:hypothetical protein
MPAGGSVLAGLRAQQSAAQAPTLQPLGGSVSPLAAQYGQWTLGRTIQSTALPRDPIEFLTGAFGPLTPIQPVGIDTPPPDSDRPEPRRWQYPVGWNMPMGMPGTEGLKLADFQTLRTYAEIYSIARACIQLRKDEMLGIGWDIGPTADAAKAMRGDSAQMKDFGNRRAQALKFFSRPDPDYNDFTSWFAAVLEDIFVIDALSLYLHPTRIPGKGLFGTDLGGLDLIDGSLIRPLLDLRGGSPAPPNPAYQEYNYGIPRVDLMTLVAGTDMKELPPPVTQFRGDQLLYLPRNPRSWTPYGQAPMERCVIPMITGLRKQQYAMDFYQEGSVPSVYISPGDATLTPNQLREQQDLLNAIAGDVAYKHKVIILPAGSKVDPQRPPELADQSDEIIMTQVCMAYSVMPMELGISPRVSATQSTGAANQMAKASENIQERKSLKPDLLWLKAALFDRIIQMYCGQTDMEWKWDGLEEDEDEQTLTTLLVAQIGAGLASIDEARIEMGRQPWGLPITSDPGWAAQMGFTPLGQISPAGAPEPGVAPPTLPQPGAPGGAPPGGGGNQPPPPGGAPGTPPPPNSSPMARVPAAGAAPPPGGSGPAPQPKPTASATGAHAAAQAVVAQAQHQFPVQKAVTSELDALRRHLNKGRAISTWEPRHIPGATVAAISEDLAKGLTVDQAVDIASAMLTKRWDDAWLHEARNFHGEWTGVGNVVNGYTKLEPGPTHVGDIINHPGHGAATVAYIDHNGNAYAQFSDGVRAKLGIGIQPTPPEGRPPAEPGSPAVETRGTPVRTSVESGYHGPSSEAARVVHTRTATRQGIKQPASLHQLTTVLTQSQRYTDSQVQEMSNQIHQLRDDYAHAEEEAKQAEHETEELRDEAKEARKKAALHMATWIGGAALAIAGGVSVLFGGPIIVAILGAISGLIPNGIAEWIDYKHGW